MIDRLSPGRRAVVLAAALMLSPLVLLAGATARADNPLPRPRVSGPTQVNNRGPLALEFNFPSVQWSYKSFWHLRYWIQYWHCDPGKDTSPTPIALQSHPWAGKTPACSLTQNHYLGLRPRRTGDSISVPREGGVPPAGTWYVRVRLAWTTTNPNYSPRLGPWSAWHRTIVSMRSEDVLSSPHILAPSDMQSFAHRDITIRMASTSKHTNRARWYFMLEWQRAQYHTSADNAFANPHPESGGFPRATGIASQFQTWSTALPVNYADLGTGSVTLHMKFNNLATGRHDTSYIYRFRVREHSKDSNEAGPWSGWSSFIVTDPVTLRRMAPTMLRRASPTIHLKRK